MATIKSGVLIGLVKSAAGLTFYNRKGTQVVRAKPQISQSYVPSDRQIFFKLMFSRVNDFAKSSGDMMRLIAGGWGWSRRGNGSTNLNNFIGYMMRLMTRAEGGERLPFEQVERNFSVFNANPMAYLLNNGAITASSWPILYDFTVTRDSERTWSIQIPDYAFREWLKKVQKISGKFRSDLSPALMMGSWAPGTPAPGKPYVIHMALGNGVWEASILSIDPENQSFQVALCVTASGDTTTAEAADFAISPILHRVVSGTQPDPPEPVYISEVWVDGEQIAAESVWRRDTTQVLSISGAGLDRSKLYFRIVGQSEPILINSLFSSSAEGGREVNYYDSNFGGTIQVTAIEQDGVSLIRFSDEVPTDPAIDYVVQAGVTYQPNQNFAMQAGTSMALVGRNLDRTKLRVKFTEGDETYLVTEFYESTSGDPNQLMFHIRQEGALQPVAWFEQDGVQLIYFNGQQPTPGEITYVLIDGTRYDAGAVAVLPHGGNLSIVGNIQQPSRLIMTTSVDTTGDIVENLFESVTGDRFKWDYVNYTPQADPRIYDLIYEGKTLISFKRFF